MKLTISEIHFIKRQLEARSEWIKDNPNDFSEEEGEKECVDSALEKLNKIKVDLEVSQNEKL